MKKKINPESMENKFEKDIRDLEEWQNNQYNPGHYIGTGKIPRPVRKLAVFPVFQIIIAVLFALPVLFYFVMNEEKDFSSMYALVLPAVLAILMIYAAMRKLIRKRKSK